MIFIFWKSTEHFVKITKCYLNHCQQAGFIHPAHPNHNYQAVKSKAGTRLCLHMHDFSHSLQRVHCPVQITVPFRLLSLGLICEITIFSLSFDCFKDATTYLCFWIFFILKSLEQIKNLCPELFVAWRAVIVAPVLPSVVGVSCS